MSRRAHEAGVILVRVQRTATEHDQSNIRAGGVRQCDALWQDEKIRPGSDSQRTAVCQAQQFSCIASYQGFKRARLERWLRAPL